MRVHRAVAHGINKAQDCHEQGDDSMSIFPTRILLATHGSREAQLAASTAADLANTTNSELHLITVAVREGRMLGCLTGPLARPLSQG
jgi:nucleotide-binding universal stress UspA family protein